jgi:TRAP-type C4-dicarboxylate transport system permease small subunit
VARLYVGLLWTLGGVAALLLPFMVISIIYDVITRDLGLPSPSWPDQMVEYAILYLTVLAAPLLTRQKGHVFVGSVRAAVPAALRAAMSRAVAAICAALCAFVSYYLVLYTWRLLRAGTPDARGFDMPRWLIIAPVALSFTLMTVEFIRFTIGRETMYPPDDVPGVSA